MLHFWPLTSTWPWDTIWRAAQMVRAPAEAADDVVEALLEEAQQHGAGVALGLARFFHVAAELLFEDVVVEAEFLLLVEADAVVPQASAAETVHPGGVELALGRVLGDVGDGHADATGELDFRTGVVGHD